MNKIILSSLLLFAFNASALSIDMSEQVKIKHTGGFVFFCEKDLLGEKYEQYRTKVKKQLEIYNKEFLEDKIKKIILCNKITLKRKKAAYAAGFYDPWKKEVYLSMKSNRNFVGTMHHEISSYILRDLCQQSKARCTLFKNRWRKNNKVNYLNKEWVNVKNNINLWWQKGFLGKYAMSNLENDFNTTAEFLLTKRLRRKIKPNLHKFLKNHLNKMNQVVSLYKNYLTPEGYQKIMEWKK